MLTIHDKKNRINVIEYVINTLLNKKQKPLKQLITDFVMQ